MTLRMYPRLVVGDGVAAIDYYVKTLGAVERERHLEGEKIVHAELELGGSTFAVKDEGDGDPSPATLGGTPVIIALDVADPDTVASAMLDAGGTVIHPVADHPYGRGGRVADPWGHHWMLMRPA